MNIAIIIAAHDGIQSVLTGVGVAVASFFESFKMQKESVNFLKNNSISLLALTPYMNKKSNDFNREVRDFTKRICNENGGELIEITTLSDGSSQQSIWGDVSQWKASSINAASTINSLSEKYDLVYVFGHDTIFSLMSKYLEGKNIFFIWIPHSLGLVFNDKHSVPERISLEKESIDIINSNENYRIGYIGESFKNVLISKYNVKEIRLVPFVNGIYFNSNRYNLSNQDINRLENEYFFPKNKRFIFSWGRCVQQKGFDILIPAFKKLYELDSSFHMILLAPTETSLKSYHEKIINLLIGLDKESYTLIDKFDLKLPYYILSTIRPELVVFPSRFEGNPIIGLEALAFNMGSKIIYSDISPYLELFGGISSAIPFSIKNNDLFNKLKFNFKVNPHANNLINIDFVKNYVIGWSKLIG